MLDYRNLPVKFLGQRPCIVPADGSQQDATGTIVTFLDFDCCMPQSRPQSRPQHLPLLATRFALMLGKENTKILEDRSPIKLLICHVTLLWRNASYQNIPSHIVRFCGLG